MSKHYNRVEGIAGEIKAAEYLKKKKYKIIEQNYRNKLGEIDIIASYKNTIIFVEVKARLTLAYGRPSEAVDKNKQRNIRNAAQLYLIQNKLLESDIRFDVIEIVGYDEINHIENAF